MNTISVVLPGDTYLEETEVGSTPYALVAPATRIWPAGGFAQRLFSVHSDA